MRKYLQAGFILTLIVGVTGCVEQYLPDEIVIDYDYLVVDGFINGGPDSSFIYLTRSTNISDSRAPSPETNASVYLEDELTTPYFLHHLGEGRYTLAPEQVNIEIGKKFRLHIRTRDGKEYLSDFVTYKPSPPIDSLSWEETKKGLTIFVNSHDPSNQTHFYKWSAVETWEYSALFMSNYIYLGDGVIVPRGLSTELYYCWRTAAIPDNSLFSTTALSSDVVSEFPLTFIHESSLKLYFGYSVLIKQQALTEEAFVYFNSLRKNSSGAGTIFAPIPSKVSGNIHCISNTSDVAIGYFLITSESTKRLMVNRQELTGPVRYDQNIEYGDCYTVLIPPDHLNDQTAAGLLFIDYLYDKKTQAFLGYVATPKECIDCRLHGGTLQQPDYWH